MTTAPSAAHIKEGETFIRKFAGFIAAALAIAAPGFAAGASYNGAKSHNPSPDMAGAQPFASSIRLAYSYTRAFGVDRSIGVVAFTNPSTGIYCIQPSSPLRLRKLFPLVSIEWSLSFGESLVAFWRDTTAGTDCPRGNLEVQTWDISTPSTPALTGNVAFDIVVN
ncbi:MAG: hypothetical protein ABI906_04185 [Pseudomonadota bacterium]